ncbi:MAG TPA: hypothetical protein V6C50_00110 [Crinalium sp.]
MEEKNVWEVFPLSSPPALTWMIVAMLLQLHLPGKTGRAIVFQGRI